jgi:hypothetical protein
MHKKLLMTAFGAAIFFASFGAAGVLSDILTKSYNLPNVVSVLAYLSIPVLMYFVVSAKSKALSYGYNMAGIFVIGISVLILGSVIKDGNFSVDNKAEIIAKIESYKKNGS